MSNIIPFEQKEREHLSKCISTRLQARQINRGKVVISISKNMLRLLQTLRSGPTQFHEIAKTDNNKVYTVNKLMIYGLIKRTHSKSVMLEGKEAKVRIISMFYITDKGRKFLEVLEMPNE